MPVCITRTEASDITDLEDEYPYQYWIADDQCLILSKVVLEGDTLSAGNGVLIKNPTTGAWVSTVTTTYYSLYSESYTTGDFLRLYYNDVTGWEAWLPDQVRRSATNWTIYYSAFGSGTLPTTVYTNGVSVPSPFTSGGSTLPSDIPPFEDIQAEINNALNASTSTTTHANQITSNIQTQIERYENGEISKEVFELNINLAQEVLEELQNIPGNTLSDQIAINNALTATQTAQDKLISDDLIDYLKSQQLISDDVVMGDPSETLNNVTEFLQSYFTDYMLGKIPKVVAIASLEGIKNSFLQASGIIYSSGGSLTDADRWLIDAISYQISQIQNNINNAGDIDSDLSDAVESSDQAEKEYLDSLTQETTASIQDISPKNSFSDVEMGTAQEVLSIIWENKLVKRLLVICGCFMVVCVVLGIRYKV